MKLTTRSIVWFSPQKCNAIIKGWLHFLTSEAKGRFLVNNILLACCLVMVQIQFSLITRNKDWMFRTPDNPPPPLHPITFHFYLTLPPHPLPSPPPQSGRYTCIAPKETDRVFAIFSHISSISKIFQISHLKKYHYNSTFS